MENANLNNLFFIQPLTVFRVGVIAALIIYVIFSFFIIRQTVLMGQVLHTKISPLIKIIAYLHFTASLLVLIISLILLTP